MRKLIIFNILKSSRTKCACFCSSSILEVTKCKSAFYSCGLHFTRPSNYCYIREQKRYVRGTRRDVEAQSEPCDKEINQDSKENHCTALAKNENIKDSSSSLQQTPQSYQGDCEDRKLKPKHIMKMLELSKNGKPEPNLDPGDVWSTSPYPKHQWRQSQERHSLRPMVDPNKTLIILFPGQGSQFVGMGKNLLKYPNVQRMYDIASEILGFDLLNMCLHGYKEELSKTRYCQPAVVVTSLAAVEKLKDESPHTVESCVATAGFSVGEITSLIFAGALSFHDGMKLVRIRAEAMQGASEMEPGGMLTVMYSPSARIGFACHAATEWCKQKGITSPVCVVANYLFPGCKVIAGSEEALKFITINAKDFGITKYKRIPVSGAFHTSLMLPAQEALKAALNSIELKTPVIPVHSNVDGKRYRDADHLKKQLPKQICAPVKWEQTMHILYTRSQGITFPKTLECGPGTLLCSILEKVNAKAYENSFNVNT